MKRRNFFGALASTAAGAPLLAGQPPKSRTAFYVLDQYFLKNGTQSGRMQEHFSRALLPALNKLHSGPQIFLEALVAPHMPQAAVIVGYSSLEEYRLVRQKLSADADFARAMQAWEAHEEPPFEKYVSTLVAATDYSPEIVTPKKPAEAQRVFELRVYRSPTHRQLVALHERFAGPEVKIFSRLGIDPLFYGETVFGPEKPNLVYLTPFDNLAVREKAWAAFAADPEWIKVRKESIDRGGQISSVIQIALYRAAAYSPLR